MYTLHNVHNSCSTNHFSQASGRIATKLAHDGLHVGLSLRPWCAQGQVQGQRSRDTGTSVLARKSLLDDYWDTWNYSLFASSLQSTISSISIKFARWQHDCGRSLLSKIALSINANRRGASLRSKNVLRVRIGVTAEVLERQRGEQM